jgi:hypothetical protein
VETIVVTRARFRQPHFPLRFPGLTSLSLSHGSRISSGHHPYSGAEVAEEQARSMPTQPANEAMKADSSRIVQCPLLRQLRDSRLPIRNTDSKISSAAGGGNETAITHH